MVTVVGNLADVVGVASGTVLVRASALRPDGANTVVVPWKEYKTGTNGAFSIPNMKSGNADFWFKGEGFNEIVTVTVPNSGDMYVVNGTVNFARLLEGVYKWEPEITNRTVQAAKEAAASRDAAKRSQDAAKASQDAAKRSQDAALASQTAAKNSEVAAKTSENQARIYRDNAQASKNAAKASQDSAAASAASALASKNAAAASQSAAKTSENNAAASAARAQEGANRVGNAEAVLAARRAAEAARDAARAAETGAASSKNLAAASASAARTSEVNAQGSAAAAKTSENNALASKNAAAASQAAAKRSQDAAKASENSALASKNAAAASQAAARTSETNAAASRTAAASSASAAATSASNAKASENQARIYAENAKNNVPPGGWPKAHMDATIQADLAKVESATPEAVGGRIASRDSYGRIRVADPSGASDVATKRYVDNADSSIRSMAQAAKSAVDAATNLKTGNTLVKRYSTGTIQAADPSIAADVATKGYVDRADNSIRSIAQAAKSAVDSASQGKVNGTLVKRHPTAATIQVGEPVANEDAATKGYVDRMAAGRPAFYSGYGKPPDNAGMRSGDMWFDITTLSFYKVV